jgi:hypothetical protein
MFRTTLLLLCAGMLHALPLLAQTTPPLHAGDQLRVRSGGGSARYAVVEAGRDTLLLERHAGGPRISLALADIRSLERSTGPRSRGQGMARHGAIGWLLGTGVGVGLGLVAGDDPPNRIVSFSAGDKALAAGLIFGTLGGIIGAVAGAATPGEAWEPVRLPARVSITPARSGPALTLTLGR